MGKKFWFSVKLWVKFKLGKNLFKLSLPEATYDQNTNYATVPNPLRKDNSIILRKDQSMDRIEVKQNVNRIQIQ